VGIGPRDVRISQGLRHSLITAGVVLAAPMSMAAASIEGSPLRDAIRAPFEGLGIVSAEERGSEPALERPAEPEASPAHETEGPPASTDLPAAGSVDLPGRDAGSDDVAAATPAEEPAESPAASVPAAVPLEPAVDAESETADGPDEPATLPAEPGPVVDDVLGDPLELVPEAVDGLP
jgi:hypothetical protein